MPQVLERKEYLEKTFVPSTFQEEEEEESLHEIFTGWAERESKPICGIAVSSSVILVYDSSSIQEERVHAVMETSLEAEKSLEFDEGLVIHMPPKRKYRIMAKIVRRGKAKPKIIAPEVGW